MVTFEFFSSKTNIKTFETQKYNFFVYEINNFESNHFNACLNQIKIDERMILRFFSISFISAFHWKARKKLPHYQLKELGALFVFLLQHYKIKQFHLVEKMFVDILTVKISNNWDLLKTFKHEHKCMIWHLLGEFLIGLKIILTIKESFLPKL